MRDLRELPPIDGDITLGVAGQAAINIDISEGLADILPIYLTVVVGLSLLIMILVFRSLLVPLIATGGFILSLFATYGALVAVFQWGWFADVLGIHSTGPILSFLPVILVGILFGLAMDYQLFLASGMREAYVHGARGAARRRAGLPRRPLGRDRRRAHHGRGVRRLHLLGVGDHPLARLRPRASACWSTRSSCGCC